MPSRKTKNVDEGMTTTPVSNQEQKQADSVAADVEAVDAACVGGSAVVEADRPCHIYVATLKGTDKRYVGITTQRVKARWRGHKTEAKRLTKTNRPFMMAIRKRGFDAFEWEWLGTLESWDEGCDAERFYIGNGWTYYNITEGGQGSNGYQHTDEAKALMSLAKKGKPSNQPKGFKHSVECKQAMSEEKLKLFKCPLARQRQSTYRKGKKASDLTRSRMSDAKKGHSTSEDTKLKISIANKGRTRTPEQKLVLSLAQTGKKQSPEVIAKRTASTLATKARKKEQKLLESSMGPIIVEVALDG